LESAVRDLVAAAAVHASRRGGDGTLQLQAQIITRSPVALADRGGTYDEQIDGSIALDGSIPAQAPSPVTSEAPLEDLLVPGRRAAVARQLLLDLTHQFAVADLLRP
jgi:hypothetical protein